MGDSCENFEDTSFDVCFSSAFRIWSFVNHRQFGVNGIVAG